MVFTFATVGVLYSSVSILRSRTQGALAALLLLGTNFFILHGTSQFADVPLGFFFLATLALLALPEVWPDDRPRLLLLAGVTAGLSAWTKNEGFLFIVAILLGYGLVIVRARGWQNGLGDARAFAIGLAPVFVMAYRYRERVYRFVINGQTGRATGSAPVSAAKVAGVIGAVGLVALVILLLVAH